MPLGPLASAGGGRRTGGDDRSLSQSPTEECPRLTPRVHPCNGSISLSFIDLVNRPTLTMFSHPVNGSWTPFETMWLSYSVVSLTCYKLR